jgi:hypothetical protein
MVVSFIKKFCLGCGKIVEYFLVVYKILFNKTLFNRKEPTPLLYAERMKLRTVKEAHFH